MDSQIAAHMAEKTLSDHHTESEAGQDHTVFELEEVAVLPAVTGSLAVVAGCTDPVLEGPADWTDRPVTDRIAPKLAVRGLWIDSFVFEIDHTDLGLVVGQEEAEEKSVDSLAGCTRVENQSLGYHTRRHRLQRPQQRYQSQHWWKLKADSCFAKQEACSRYRSG